MPSDPSEETDGGLQELNLDQPAPDLGARRQQIRQMVDARAAGEFEQAHPFNLSTDRPPVPTNRYRQAEATVLEQDRTDAMAQRAQEIARRRQQTTDTEAFNSKARAQYEGSGQLSYIDPLTKRLVPVLEPWTNRPLFKVGDKSIGQDRQGLPAIIQRDKYGQQQYRRPPLKASEDPLEGQLYADLGDGQSVPYMSVDDALKHPDIQIRRQGMVADRARKNALRAASEEERKNALAPLEGAVTSADLQIKKAKDRRDELDQSMKELENAIGGAAQTEAETTGLIMKTPTQRALVAKKINDQRRAQLSGLQTEADAIDESLKPRGALSGVKADAESKRAVFKAQAIIATYDDQIGMLQDRMKSGGGNPEKDAKTLATMQAARKAIADGLEAHTPQPPPPVVQPEAGPAPVANIHPDQLPAEWAKSSPMERLKMLFGVRGYGQNEVEGAVPMIGSEAAGTKGGAFTIPKAQGTGVMAGIDNAVNKFISGMTTPENAGIMAATGGAGALADLAAATRVAVAARATEAATMGTFTGLMAKDTVTATQDAVAVMADPKATKAEKADAIATAILSGAMTGAAGAGTVDLVGRTRAEARAAGRTPPPAHEAGPPAPTEPTPPATPTGARVNIGGAEGTIFGEDAQALARLREAIDQLSPDEQAAKLAEMETEGSVIPAEPPLSRIPAPPTEIKSAEDSAIAFGASDLANRIPPQRSAQEAAQPFIEQEYREAAYRDDPLGADPERYAAELRQKIDESNEAWNARVRDLEVEARRAGQADAFEAAFAEQERQLRSPQGATDLGEHLGREGESNAELMTQRRADVDQRRQEQAQRAEGMESGLAEQERIRQSQRGGELLREDLRGNAGEEPPSTTAPIAPTPIGPSEKWYRGRVAGATEDATHDQFYSTSRDVADEFSAKDGGQEGNVTEHSRKELPDQKDLYQAVNKEGLAEDLGLENPYGHEFDAKVRDALKKRGYKGVQYAEGTDLQGVGEGEIHVFGEEPNVNIGPRDQSVSTGTGVPTAKEEAMLKEQRRLVEEYQKAQKPEVAKESPSAAKLPEVSTPESVAGEKISKQWTAFGPESKSLGIPRAEMPQIKSEARGALVNFLKARDITAKPGMIMPTKLKPTQAEFSPEKVQMAREHEGSDRPILVSGDGHVVDGHHQWMAALDDPNTPMPVIQLNAPIEKVLAEMKEFPSTESASGAKAVEPTKAPAATIPLSDRAIAALQKAKIGKPGRILSADPFTVAYDAAIDFAILAIRAGRAVGDVVKLATQRFMAKHPKATTEEIARITQAINSAVSQPTKPVTPESKPSLLPESLKAAGAPAETINYEVRTQDARKQEASDIIKRDGAAKAEEMITSSELPGDTKVAIGGQLINDKMLSLAKATPEEAAKLARDIQRITAKMQPKLATEAGQTISMFGGIYDDVRTATAMEYIRDAQGKRLEKIGGEEGGKAADEAAKIFNKTKDPAAREKEIDKLKERYTTKPVRRMLDQLKRMEVAQKLNDLGVLTRDDMVEVAGNALGIPGISQKRLKHIAELADRVHTAKNHAERSRADLELTDTLNIYKGVSPLDLEASILTLNILSGPTTQAANILGNTLQGISQIGHAALANPTKVRALVDGILDGIPDGMTQAKSILATGRGSRDFADKTGGSSNVLNTIDYAEDYPSLPKKAADALTLRARMVEKISRFMKAADAVFYYPAREAYARLVTTKLLEGQYKGDELDAKVDQLLHTTTASFESARKQAEGEGYDGIDLGRRVSDIIEERRAQTPIGAEAVKQSERFAAESTYNQEPVGLAGVIYRNLARTSQEANIGGVPILKPWTMFLKIPANVFNETTNFTPIGGVRATFGMQGEKYRKGGTGEGQWRNFNRDERNRLYLKSIVGTTLMAGLVARSIQNPDDTPIVSANGPQDTAKRRQLMNAGWKPYSIRVGDKWISYRDSPLLVPLAVAGHVSDSLRYNKPEPDVTTEQRVADAVLASPQTIFQTSMLSGMADLMASLSGKGGGVQAVGRTLGSIPANLVIPYNRLLQQIDQTFDPKTYDTNAVVGGVPFVRRMGNEIADVQGRSQTYSPSDRFASAESKDPVDRLLLDKNLAIPEVGRDAKIGNRNMTEDEHDLYRKISGQRIRVRLQTIEPRLRGMTREKAQDEIERISREERARVKPRIAAQVPMATAAK